MVYNRIKTILPVFSFKGAYESSSEMLSGNVNNTYHLIYNDEGRKNEYILQRINSYVFKEPENVMKNIIAVTDHLRRNIIKEGLDPERRVLRVIPTVKGNSFYSDQEDGYWRAYNYITNATAHDMVTNLDMLYEVGRGFGSFQKLLFDFPADDLFTPIPNFHNTLKRFYTFVRSVDEDKVGRVAEVEDEIEFFFERRRMMSEITHLLDNGTLPLRVTHNDTKSNNVMVDDQTGKAICVIDLDTVMPGSSLYDYGDAVRFGCSTASEDEPDTRRIALDLDKFTHFTKGFLAETNGFLTCEELRRLPLGIKVITCELAMRFLTDYIDGDLYFKVNSPTHNLVRARAQIALLRDIEGKEYTMQRIIDDILNL